MENKINIAELLRDCPKGMELDCTMFENLEFECIDDVSEYTSSILCRVKTNNGYINHSFSRYGCYTTHEGSKCVIFPKGKTTWEGFHRPFKDGDILTTILGSIFIYRKIDVYNYCGSYASLDIHNGFLSTYHSYLADCSHLATEEEKQKLFDAIKANGYRWNEKTKTLEKLIEPRFKVGDRIKYKNGRNKDGVEEGIILSITDDTYDVAVTNDMGIFIPVTDQDNWELVPTKFDITTLKPFDKVLYRMHHNDTWFAGFYNVCIKNKIFVIGLSAVPYCIPYEANKELLGTTNDCDDFYKTWEK